LDGIDFHFWSLAWEILATEGAMNRIKFIFAWYDLWVGVYYDRKAYKLYILPLPMLGVVIDCLGYYAIRSPYVADGPVGYCTSIGVNGGDVDRHCTLTKISKREFLKH